MAWRTAVICIYICLYVCMCVWVCVCENCITKRFCKSDLLIKLNNLTDAIDKAIWTDVNYLDFAKAIDSVRNKNQSNMVVLAIK